MKMYIIICLVLPIFIIIFIEVSLFIGSVTHYYPLNTEKINLFLFKNNICQFMKIRVLLISNQYNIILL